MSMIDRYAYNNRLRPVDPAHKAALALAVLLVCLAATERGTRAAPEIACRQ